MSLVTDVIASIKTSGGPICKDASLTQMEDLIIRSEKSRDNVYKSLESRYCALSQALHDTSKLQESMDSCLTSMTNIENKIQDEILGNIESSVGEVGRVAHKWKEVKGELEAAQLLLEIHSHLENNNEALLKQQYSISAKSLNSIEKLLIEAAEREILNQLDIIDALKEELIIKRNDLIFNIGEVWTSTIVWGEEDELDGSKCPNFSIRSLSNIDYDLNVLLEIVLALEAVGELKRRMKMFGKFLLQHFISPIIRKKSNIECLQSADMHTFKISHQNQNERTAVDSLNSVQDLLLALYNVLLHVKIKGDDPKSSLMAMLGREMGDDFTKLILKDCLAEAVPCNKRDLKSYDDVIVQAESFQKFLVSVGFYTPDQKSLLDYAANVETVFSNKACANLLNKARTLMMQPLHITATIGPLVPDGPLTAVNESGQVIKSTTKQLEKILSSQTFNLPKCHVSVSACQLVDLVYDTLEEACQSSAEYAGRLFYTVRNILSLYSHVVPTAHSQTLANIPQSAALVHNNSFFVAHHALLFGHQYGCRLPLGLRDASLTTVDIAQEIRTCGTDIFLKAMQSHRATLLETLREGSSLPSLGCEISAISSLQSSVMQSLHQFERLHSVWQGVLPHSVYTKTFGALVSSVVEDLVMRIVSLQDISADSALGLINVLNLIKNKIPPFFKVSDEPETSENDVIREVKIWGKMAELVVVLGANLRQLVDRWADGKGPLAHHFTADEAKQLIRALFQNTDRRAQVLATIV